MRVLPQTSRGDANLSQVSLAITTSPRRQGEATAI